MNSKLTETDWFKFQELRFENFNLRLRLFRANLRFFYARLQIRVLTFQCNIFILRQRKALKQNGSGTTLVNQLFNTVEWLHVFDGVLWPKTGIVKQQKSH